MILLSSRKMEKCLYDGTLSSWDKAKHLILLVALGHIALPARLLAPVGLQTSRPSVALTAVLLLAMVCIAYAAVRRCYEVNRSIDDRAFLERLVLLEVPVFLRLFLTLVPALIFGSILFGHVILGVGMRRISEGIAAISVLVALAHYWMLSRSFFRFAVLRQGPSRPMEPGGHTDEVEPPH